MSVQTAGFKANLRAPFGHKLSFGENKHVAMKTSMFRCFRAKGKLLFVINKHNGTKQVCFDAF